jgi:hypothetical protein
MTLAGKILLFVNLVLALGMAFWAVGVYTRYIDYKTPAPPGADAGPLAKLDSAIKAKSDDKGELSAAELRWKTPYTWLGNLTTQRQLNREWYAKQLVAMQQGPGPVQVASIKAGQPELDPKQYGRPLLVEAKDATGQPLQPLTSYEKALTDTRQAILAAQAELEKQIKVDTELTQKIGGDNGVRAQLAREEQKQKDVRAEQEYLRPLLVNSLVEGELLVKRRADLEARVKELKAIGVARSR